MLVMENKICLPPAIYLLRATWQELCPVEAEWMRLLPKERQAELRKIQNLPSRLQSLAGEILARRAAALLGCSAFQWEWGRNARGKPYFPQAPFFHFNISHTDGLVVCATAGSPVGVDAESSLRRVPLAVIRRMMTPLEKESILQLPEEEQPLRFYEIWTRKEAYGKWMGEGITAAMNTWEVTRPPLKNQIATFMWNRWVVSVCGEPGQSFKKIEIPTLPFLTGEWVP